MSIQSILTDMEWDEGLSLPVANVENKHLEEKFQQKSREIIRLQADVSEYDDRVHALSEHMKNVRQELGHTQGLCQARKKELETEEHLYSVAQREEGRLKQEITRLENDLAELKERKNIYENSIFKQTQKLEEMKSQMNWDQQALEAWLEESARKDEDAMTLAKYTRMDESKVKEISLQTDHLTDEMLRKRKALDHEVTETLTTQLELDKLAEEFRKAHRDRQELIRQWESTIEQMQRRDNEMDQLSVELARVKAQVRGQEESVKEKQQFLESEMENNSEQEKKIQASDRVAAKLRLDYREQETQRIQFRDELETLKHTVERTATDTETTRKQVADLKREVEDRQDKLEQAHNLNEDLADKLEAVINSELSAQEYAARMDELLAQEEQSQKQIDLEVKQLREQQFRKSQELYNAKLQEKQRSAEILGSRAASRNLSSRISKLDHDSLKQQEIIYNQDFQIQQLERRISRMQGEHNTEELDLLNARIKEMSKVLENRNNTHSLLNLQLKRLQDDIRRVKRDLDKSGKEKGDLTNKMEELDLHNDSSQRELKKIIASKQDLMVDENILKLEIKRMRDILNSKADEVLSLEKRRLQLDTAMRERHQEIQIHKDLLWTQLKSSKEEKSTVSAELQERISKIDKLRKRYEILMVSMAPPEGEEDKSQAYYVIKAAQEKEELQREGDELDAAIRKAEKEIRALENTLRLMNGRNEQYRKSFNRVTETSQEYEDKVRLEEQNRAIMDKYKYKRRQIRELQEDLQTMSTTLDNLVRDENAYMEMIEEKQNKILQLSKEIEDQGTKLERVNKQNARYAREVRSAKKSKEETFEERDFNLRELRDFNKNMMRQIGEVMHSYSEITPMSNMLFAQAGIQPPPPPSAGSRHGSRPGSSRSARSDHSSLKTPSTVRSTTSSRAYSRGSQVAPKTVELGAAGLGVRGSPMQSPSGSKASSRASSRGSAR